MTNARWLTALVPLAAFCAAPAHACSPGTFTQHANGEDYCLGTSDGGHHPYRPSTINVTRIGQGAHGPRTKGKRLSSSPSVASITGIEGRGRVSTLILRGQPRRGESISQEATSNPPLP